MRKILICQYCNKEVKEDEAVHNGRCDEPRYDGEPVWHIECYEKEHDYARDKGLL